MQNIKCETLFTVFFLILLLSTYLGFGEEALIVVAGYFFVKKTNRGLSIPNRMGVIYFILYYAMLTVMGLLTGQVGLKNFLQFFIKYVCIPFVVWQMIPGIKKQREKSIVIFRNFCLVSAAYGTIEWVLRYNFVSLIIRIDAGVWMQYIRGLSSYQPCSLFLHYNFYALILLVGWVLLEQYPIKNKCINLMCKLLLVSQLLLAQSRISWVCFGVVLIYYYGRAFLKSDKIRRSILGLIILLAIGLCVYPQIITKIYGFVFERFAPVFKYGLAYGSLGQRVGTFFNLIPYFSENALKGTIGTGFSSVFKYLEEYSYFAGYPTTDCQWTTYLVECGIVGTLILIVVLFRYWITKEMGCFHYLSKLLLLVFLVESLTFEIMDTSFTIVVVAWGILIAVKNVIEVETEGI